MSVPNLKFQHDVLLALHGVGKFDFLSHRTVGVGWDGGAGRGKHLQLEVLGHCSL